MIIAHRGICQWLVLVGLLCWSAGAMAQQTVEGTVTDATTGETLPGVNVLIENTSKGASTDLQGHYLLESVQATDTLVFSFIGYQTQRIPVSGRSTIDVTLKPIALTGQELVVVGYGVQQKSDITSAIGSIDAEGITNKPVQRVGQVLQGKIAGVRVTKNSGAPGAGLMVRVRGTGTLNNSDPLYVIDGNPVAGPYNLPPHQIESIEVLKSASAAAIYGSRGANGVILITTKSGSPNDSRLELNYYEGVQSVSNKIDLVNGKQYAQLYNQALTNAGEDPVFGQVDTLGPGTNWQDAIFRAAPIRNLSLSYSGGNQKSTYYISGGYFKQKGIIIGSDYDRLSFRVNSEHQVTPFLTLGENLSLGYATRNTIPEFLNVRSVVIQAMQMDPTVPVKYPNGDWGIPRYSNTQNPVALVEYTHNRNVRPTVTGNAYIDIEPTENLVYHSQFNLSYGFDNVHIFNPKFDLFPEQRNLVPSVTRTDSRWQNWAFQNTLTYKNDFGSHSFTLLGGFTMQSVKTEFFTASGQGIPPNANSNESLRYLDLVTSGQQVSGGAGSYGMVSYLGRLNYDYKDTYLATVNFRIDGSSKFGNNNRFGYFPSFSVGWRISNEPFLKDVAFINDLMIRAGWGELGNQNSLSNYAFANVVTNNINYVFGREENIIIGQAPVGQGNPNLKWETTQETNIGLSFTGFQNRVTITADYYYKKTSDLLLRIPIVDYAGIQQPSFVNGGDILNKGIELSVGYQRLDNEDFTYSISFNIARNINEVTQLSNEGAAIFSGGYQSLGTLARTAVGHPIASFYGYVMEGIFQNEQQVENHAFQATGTAPGDIIFKDLNGDDVINQEDQTYIGNPAPDFTYGLNAHFSWKNFDLNVSLQGVYGNEIFAAWKYYTHGSNFFNFSTDMLHAWDGEGSSHEVPRLTISDPNKNARKSSYYIEDGSYLRLKNLQIGYTLPLRWTEKIKIQKLRIYLSGQNLLTFTSYEGYDPEIGSPGTNNPLDIGIDRGYYPIPRTLTAGINIAL